MDKVDDIWAPSFALLMFLLLLLFEVMYGTILRD